MNGVGSWYYVRLLGFGISCDVKRFEAREVGVWENLWEKSKTKKARLEQVEGKVKLRSGVG